MRVIASPRLELHHGCIAPGRSSIPILGLGLSHNSHPSVSSATQVVVAAMDAGVRLLDTAERYGTEPSVCAGLEQLRAHWRLHGSAVSSRDDQRTDVAFITSKIGPRSATTAASVVAAYRQSCAASGLSLCHREGYVVGDGPFRDGGAGLDLYLVHWPGETWLRDVCSCASLKRCRVVAVRNHVA